MELPTSKLINSSHHSSRPESIAVTHGTLGSSAAAGNAAVVAVVYLGFLRKAVGRSISMSHVPSAAVGAGLGLEPDESG